MIYPIILCGGSGTRLWPLSRDMYPKQFVDLGNGRTLFGDTIRRAAALPDTALPLVVCNEAHRFYVSAELLACSVHGKIILEPAPRNTAPAIALAAFAAQRLDDGDEPLLLVLPSDHLLQDSQAFSAGVASAALLAQKGFIVTFGIRPDSPKTGFGYIKQGDALKPEGFRVARFIEKPDKETATAMLEEGGYSWNSGMFLLKASVYLSELQAFAPQMYTQCQEAWEQHRDEGAFIYPGKEALMGCPSNSIDYAVMEHTKLAAVCPLATDWNDLGSWEAFYQVGKKDQDGNVCTGDVIQENAHNCYLYGTHRLLTAIDIHDLAVIETQDSVLVAPRDSAQGIKQLVARLKKAGRPEYKIHPFVYRPWGSYELLASGTRFQVKRITVNPGAQLSLQLHYHRAEHWVVVSGTAEITNGNDVKLYTENQSTYIPLGTVHRLKNPGKIPLVIIEIQSGSYLGEDDIIRLEDAYGRDTTGKKE